MDEQRARARELGLLKRRASRTIVTLGLLDESDVGQQQPQQHNWAQRLIRRAFSEDNMFVNC